MKLLTCGTHCTIHVVVTFRNLTNDPTALTETLSVSGNQRVNTDCIYFTLLQNSKVCCILYTGRLKKVLPKRDLNEEKTMTRFTITLPVTGHVAVYSRPWLTAKIESFKDGYSVRKLPFYCLLAESMSHFNDIVCIYLTLLRPFKRIHIQNTSRTATFTCTCTMYKSLDCLRLYLKMMRKFIVHNKNV